jgi:hypothetical protein
VKVISDESQQLRLLRAIVHEMEDSPSQSISVFYVAAYASLLGRISEQNLISLFRWSGVDHSDKNIRALFSYIRGVGMTMYIDNGMGFVKNLPTLEQDGQYDEKIIRAAKKIVNKIRNELGEE